MSFKAIQVFYRMIYDTMCDICTMNIFTNYNACTYVLCMYYNKFYLNVCLIEALKIQLCNVLCDIFTAAEELCGQGGQLPSQLLAGFNSPRFILTRVRYIS